MLSQNCLFPLDLELVHALLPLLVASKRAPRDIIGPFGALHSDKPAREDFEEHIDTDVLSNWGDDVRMAPTIEEDEGVRRREGK